MVDAEKPFRYYGDFKNAQFNLIEPKSCPISGSTNIKIYGQGFKSRNVPARLSSPLRDRNQKEEEEKGTYIEFCPPSGWPKDKNKCQNSFRWTYIP